MIILKSIVDKKVKHGYEGEVFCLAPSLAPKKELLAKIYSDDIHYLRKDKSMLVEYFRSVIFHNRTGYKDITKHAETCILVLRILGSRDFQRVASARCLKMLLKKKIIKYNSKSKEYVELKIPFPSEHEKEAGDERFGFKNKAVPGLR
jgi:hypothetical protein